MPATLQNLTLWADRTVQISVPVLDQNGVPYNLAGGSATWGMASAAQTVAVVAKSTAGGGITLVNNGGTWSVVISILPSDTAQVAPGIYYHELAVQDGSGNVVNVSIGAITLNPSLNQY